MLNTLVDGHEAADIELQIEKILRGLGNPEPPLSLDGVRELLRLDRQYYSSEDQTAVREVVSRLIVAGKQVIARPTLLFEVIRKAKVSALWIPDKKRILIDRSTPALKHRWSEAHEIGHSIIPWHKHLLLGDNEYSLNPICHQQLEAEANYAAGELLFMKDRFSLEARDLPVSLETVRHLKQKFSNTFTSTLWKYIEDVNQDRPIVGVVSEHPHHPSESFDPAKPCRHCIHSSEFRRHFSSVTELELFRAISGYCNLRRGGPLGAGDVMLKDNRGDRHLFHFESFSVKYYVLSMGVYVRHLRPQVCLYEQTA